MQRERESERLEPQISLNYFFRDYIIGDAIHHLLPAHSPLPRRHDARVDLPCKISQSSAIAITRGSLHRSHTRHNALSVHARAPFLLSGPSRKRTQCRIKSGLECAVGTAGS